MCVATIKELETNKAVQKMDGFFCAWLGNMERSNGSVVYFLDTFFVYLSYSGLFSPSLGFATAALESEPLFILSQFGGIKAFSILPA